MAIPLKKMYLLMDHLTLENPNFMIYPDYFLTSSTKKILTLASSNAVIKFSKIKRIAQDQYFSTS